MTLNEKKLRQRKHFVRFFDQGVLLKKENVYVVDRVTFKNSVTVRIRMFFKKNFPYMLYLKLYFECSIEEKKSKNTRSSL